MIRTAILCTMLTAPAVADERAPYLAALDSAAAEYQAEYDARGPSSYAIDELVTDGFLPRWDKDDVQTIEVPELVALYDTVDRICSWGFQTEDYPALPRTAALAVQDHAIANDWPEDAISRLQSNQGTCGERSLLATTVGDLIFIDRMRLGRFVVYLGFVDPQATS